MGTVHIEPKHEVTRPLTKKQRNDVFKWLEAAGWSPGRFQWGMAQADQRVLAALVYKADQDYLFAIDPYAAGDMSVTFRPGADEVETEADELHWSGVETYLILWLQALRDELEEPDLWANLGTLPDVAEGGDSDHNEPFSREEVRVIGERVDRVRGLLEVASLAPDVLADVFSLLESLMNVGLAFGAIIVPVLVGLSGAPAALIGTGVVFLLVFAVAWRKVRAVDAAADVPHVEIRLLQSIPIFGRLPAPQLEGLARALEPVTYGAGETVMCEGEEGDFYCAIAEGEVQVSHAGHTVAHLSRGEGFGEIALIEEVPRTATVTTTEPTEVYCLQKAPFILALTGHATAKSAAASVVARRRDELQAAESEAEALGGAS